MAKRTKLIALRQQNGWYQKDVVKRLHEDHGIKITESYYGMIEQGVRTPSLELAIAISNLFGRQVNDLFFEGNPNETLGKRDQPTARGVG